MRTIINNILNKNKHSTTVHLHIGTHKTGTTSLQKFFDINKKVLDKHGILYPKTGWYHHSQHLLAFQLKGSTPNGIDTISESIWADLHKEIKKSKHQDVIISSEIFATLNAKQIESLKERLSSYDVKIYVYLRRQEELFESMYNQQVKEWRNSRKEPIRHFMNNMNKLCPYFNYFQMVNNWALAFKKENIHIRPYHKKYVIDTVLDFVDLIGLDENIQKLLKSVTNENNSVSTKALEMIRLSKFVEDDIMVRERVFHLANKVFPSTKSNKKCLKSEQRIKITEKYAQSNEKLIRQYFGEGKEYLLSVSPTIDNPETLSKVDLLNVVINMINKG